MRFVTCHLFSAFMIGYLAACASAQTPTPVSLNKVFIDMGKVDVDEVKIRAAQQANPKDGPVPKFRSTAETPNRKDRKPDKVFEGCFIAAKDDTKLAIFSDDGVDLYIDGELVHKKLTVGQHLPNLTQSFHVVTTKDSDKIEFTFKQDQSYRIRIEFKNMIYNIDPNDKDNIDFDVDGATLFAYKGGGFVVDVEEIHPIDTDFAKDRAGRIMISTNRDDNDYHTVKKTTLKKSGESVPAQTRDARVTISAYITPKVAGVTVYFEVIDPDDASPYNEDTTPSTVYDFKVTPDHNIDGAGPLLPNTQPDANPNDNRDRRFTMVGGFFRQYKFMQQSSLIFIRSAKTQLKTIDGKMKAVAEVDLKITKRFSGDNYIVRATCINPNGKPFNKKSGVSDLDDNPDAGADIPDDRIKSTSLLTAWKRIYVEQDTMYRVGSFITALGANVGDTKIEVASIGVFGVGDNVRVFDADSREGALLTINGIDLNNNELTLSGPLTSTSSFAMNGYVGKETGTDATDFFLPDTSKLTETFDDAYIEFTFPPEGATGVPRVRAQTRLRRDALGTGNFSKRWFNNRVKRNYLHLVGAETLAESATTFGSSSFRNNYTYIFVGSIERFFAPTPLAIPIVIREVTNHEFVHHWEISFKDSGHDNERAWDNKDQCLMDIEFPPIQNIKNDKHELGTDHLYRLRDSVDRR